MIVYENVSQGTKKWLELRRGIPTASCFDKIITPAGKPSSSTEGYLNLMLAERIMRSPVDGYTSKYMADGNTFEDNAVAAYEFANDCETGRMGFVTTDDGLIGCSPDRFIIGEPRGMLECKAPSAPVHVSYLRAATGASKEYKVQLQGELWVCERDWVDIISYHPDMPDALFRVYRDEPYIKEMEAQVRAFSMRLEEMTADFRGRGWIKDAPEVPGDESLWLTQDDIDAAVADVAAQFAGGGR
jgi:hypothetical protein